jgi:hypothetical protein
VEERHSEFFLEALDLVGESRLRDVKAGRCPVEPALFDDRDEALELVDFHTLFPVSGSIFIACRQDILIAMNRIYESYWKG